jgi:mono/diheme cytochrome c family protein
MRVSLSSIVASILLLVFAAAPLRAQEGDVFAFIPPGGRTLLSQLVDQGLPSEELQAILSGKRSRDEWVAFLKERQGAVPALQGLGETELLTLADYLAFNMPAPGISAQASAGELAKALPPDGRDFALTHCQSCHIVTVVVTQDRTKEAWLGTMNKPSHIEIELTPAQREALANYLVLNAGIPIDLVPEELRAGGASY